MFLGGKGNKNKPQKKGIENMKYYKFTIKDFKDLEIIDNYLETSETSEEELALYEQELVDEFLSFRGYESTKGLGFFAEYKEITQREYEEEL